MAKMYQNGVYRDMTAEELDIFNRISANIPEETKDEIKERLERLEKLFSNILPFLEKLGVKVE